LTEQEKTKLRVVYTGQRQGNDRKPYHTFIPYEALQRLNGHSCEAVERVLSLYKLRSSPTVIGGTYESEGEIEGSKVTRLVTNKLVYAGKESHPHLGAWEAFDQATKLQSRRAAIEKKAGQDKYMLDQLQRIKHVYKKLAPADRLPFQLWLINELSR
jgi:hypothetical protein